MIALAVPTAAAAKPPLTKGVYSGVITVGRGAVGITLGMTRAQVVAHLGRPFADHGGEMDYFRLPPKYPSRGLFVVYLAKGHVRECPRICVGMSERERHVYTNAAAHRVG
jgi:hypothetical protein